MSPIKVRFAPSPTGQLHVGNLRTALVNYLFARKAGGSFMLRIDDTDEERSSEEYETAIRFDLDWMGMNWDFEERQSLRLDRYNQALTKLVSIGRAYPCYETPNELSLKRKALLSAGRPPVYDRAGLKLSEVERAQFESDGRRPHWRFLLNEKEVGWHDMVRGNVNYHMSSLSDPVLMREDGRVIYTLASVVDDIDHSITHIIRGEDHVTNSAAQIQLFQALGSDAPLMGHVALLTGADGEGLSKRLGSLSVNQLRSQGIESVAIASLLARIGTADPIVARTQLTSVIENFDLGKFGRATAKFDPEELVKLNGQIVQDLDFAAVESRLADIGVDGDEAFWLAVRGNLVTLRDAKIWWDICIKPLTPVIDSPTVTNAAAAFLPIGDLNREVWTEWTKIIAAETGVKGRELFMPIRLALTGRHTGPEIAPLLVIMGRDRVIQRLQGKTA